jgi:starch-binding outer membrane protein, SusD/RagB family
MGCPVAKGISFWVKFWILVILLKMKKMKFKKLVKIVLFLQVILFMSCSDDWLNEKPQSLITSESLYDNYTGFELGLNGLYNLVRQERDADGGTMRVEMFVNGTDNMVPNLSDFIVFGKIAVDWANANNSEDNSLNSNFIWLYRIVNSANTIINQVENRDDIDWTGGIGSPQENKNSVIAEAKAIRAWAYRHLTFCWGDVPLNMQESLGSNIKMDWIRTPVAEVRNQMKSDMLFAEKHLNIEPSSPGKITKGAVQHYLAELYLVLEKPDSALFWSNKCIDTPEYKLITNRYGVKANEPGVTFMDMFTDGNALRHEGNTESLWTWEYEYGVTGGGSSIMRRWHTSRYELISIDGIRPLKYSLERGGRGIFRMSMTKWALDIYEPQDDRFSNFAIRKYFILKDAIQNAPGEADLLPAGYSYGDTIKLDWTRDITPENSRTNYNWPYSRKFESTPDHNLQSGSQYNDQVYLRLADTYLLKAEAQFKLGNPDEAAQTINIIRNRSNASPVNGSQIDIDFILDERSRELFYEEHRRYTLLRTGKWLERVQKYNKNGGQTASERDVLFPIPQVVIDANLTTPMQQNPGFN